MFNQSLTSRNINLFKDDNQTEKPVKVAKKLSEINRLKKFNVLHNFSHKQLFLPVSTLTTGAMIYLRNFYDPGKTHVPNSPPRIFD